MRNAQHEMPFVTLTWRRDCSCDYEFKLPDNVFIESADDAAIWFNISDWCFILLRC